MKKEAIKIFTDGASRGNPGPGGWGAVLVLPKQNETNKEYQMKKSEEVVELGGGEKNTTNNRMELTAVIKALEFSSKNIVIRDSSFIVHTDSSYVLKGSTLWVHGWKKNNWKTKTKDDVLNKDLWEKFLKVSGDLKISWNLLKGHSGVPGNERCDEIATSFADNKKINLYSGPLSLYEIDVTHVAQTVSQKKKNKVSSKTKAYSYVSSVGGVVKIHTTWAECEARVKGKSGALFKKSLSSEDEKKIIASWKK